MVKLKKYPQFVCWVARAQSWEAEQPEQLLATFAYRYQSEEPSSNVLGDFVMNQEKTFWC